MTIADSEHAAASTRQGLERFFNELAPRLEAARTVERELDRQLARQFNAFDYLRPDELRLSKMIGDLLDPKGPHGQGHVFLRLLLDRVGFDYGGDLRKSRVDVELMENQHGGDLRKSRVDVELLMENQRRLDVAVDVGGGRHCLAIENKPFAGDQKDQIKAYLGWLRENYGDRFLLIYLSPRGEAPSDYSVKLTDLQDEAGNPVKTFRIMPYHRAEDGAGDDEFGPFRTGFGLADWLRECREHCDVERLRWFLREAETFCERRFGGSAMTTGERKIIKDFLLADDRNWATACAIQGALPEIAADVRRQFLETIANRLKGLGYKSEWNYSDKAWQSWVQAYLPQWREYPNAVFPERSRTCLCLEAGQKQGNGWVIGIRSPLPKTKMTGDDLRRRERIDEHLERLAGVSKNNMGNEWWPWKGKEKEFVVEEYRNWDLLIPDLRRESQQDGGGKIAGYFVDKFVEIAEFAKPILDDIERSTG